MITMNDIIREGHPTLREKAQDVVLPLSKEDYALAEDMMTFLKYSQDPELAEKYELRGGVGLAAPQLDISKRMIAVHIPNPHFTGEDDTQPTHLLSTIMINPKIISHSVQLGGLEDGEGCLSVDRAVEGVVVRHLRITVTYTDLEGHTQKIKLRDYAAMVVQHEIDHLNGIMFYDRIDEKDPYAQLKDIKLI